MRPSFAPRIAAWHNAREEEGKVKLEKEIEMLIRERDEIRSAGEPTEKQTQRLAKVEAELAAREEKDPGIIGHVTKDIEQGKSLLGHKNAQKCLSLVRRKLFPLAVRSNQGLVVSSEAIGKLNREGAGIGRNTLISLEQNKLVTRMENGDLVLPWEWDI